MKTFRVVIAKEAEADINSIYDFIAATDDPQQAEEIENRLFSVIMSLEKSPLRGRIPPEMLRIGITEFREIQSPPWRIFYYVDDDLVGIVAVIDAHRNVTEHLYRRLLQ